MEFLIIARADLEPLDESETVDRLREIPGLQRVSDSTMGDRLSASYDYEGDSTIVRLSDDLRRISIFGVGPASRELAVAVARALRDMDLRIFDVDYQFDVQLPKGAPPEELRRKIESLAR